MHPPIPPELRQLARLFRQAGFALYGVGGMVRNPLLGLPVSDCDVCSAMPPGRLMALCRAVGARAAERPGGLGGVELCFEGLKMEHTTFRTESYTSGHSPDHVEFTDDIRADAFRRDFAVNAIYMDLLTGELIDPAGGLADVERRLIRATSPEPARIMAHDGERILRMCRFAAELGFAIDPGTFDAAKGSAAGLLALSPARVRKELDRILLSDARYGEEGAALAALTALEGCGALDALLPEVTAGRGIQQRRDYHRHDVLWHLIHTAAALPPILELRLAGLLHDVGKPSALAASGKMYSHDVRGAAIAREILARLGYPAHLREQVCQLIRHHMYDLRSEARESTLRAWFAARGRGLSRGLVELRRGDVHGSGIVTGGVDSAERWRGILARMEAEGAPFSEKELAVTGADIVKALAIAPGPRVGEIKRKLLYHCAKHPRDNTRERLLSIARDCISGGLPPDPRSFS